jgi:hypothetical protein
MFDKYKETDIEKIREQIEIKIVRKLSSKLRLLLRSVSNY